MKKNRSRWARLQAITAVHELYGPLCPVCSTLADLTPRWQPTSPAATASFIQQVLQGLGPTDVHQALWAEHYGTLIRYAEAGYGHPFSTPRSRAEWELTTRLRQDLAYFAASKQQALARELAPLRALPRAEYLRQAQLVAARYNTDYLQAESLAALASAQSAEAWPEIQRRKFLYPNLRYVTAGDERVRQAHRTLDDQVHPVDSPFWDMYYTPNGYRCRCRVVQTDAPVTDSEPPAWTPDPGLRHNPGKTGRIFDDAHPYHTGLQPSQPTALRSGAEAVRARYQLGEASQATGGATFRLPSGPVMQLPQQLTTLLATPSPQPALRIDVLLAIRHLIALIQPSIAASSTYTLRVLGYTFTLTLDSSGVLISIL